MSESHPADRIERYKARAQGLRKLAMDTVDPRLRDGLLQSARDYEFLAESVEFRLRANLWSFAYSAAGGRGRR